MNATTQRRQITLPMMVPHSNRANSRTQSGRAIVGLFFLIAFYYVSYRYPFQIGDGDLSPTYSATPVWLQLGKFVLLAILFGMGWFRLRPEKGFYGSEILISAFSVTILASCAVYAFFDLRMAIRFAEIGFIPIMATIFTSTTNIEMKSSLFIRSIRWFFWLNIAAYIVQFLLFWFFDRLPGLAFGGATTRFGGIWDDPNSALAPFLLYVPYYIVMNGLTKGSIFLMIMTGISVIISQSGTSLIALALTVPIVLLFFSARRSYSANQKIALLVAASLFVFGCLASILYLSNAIDVSAFMRELSETLRMKQESAEQRGDSYTILNQVSFLTLIGMDPVFKAGENQFVNIFANFGIIALGLFIAIHFSILRHLSIWTKLSVSRESYALAVSCSCYFIWHFASMVNLPKAEVFPVNLLAAIVAGLAIASKNRLEQEHAAGSAGSSARKMGVIDRKRSSVV